MRMTGAVAVVRWTIGVAAVLCLAGQAADAGLITSVSGAGLYVSASDDTGAPGSFSIVDVDINTLPVSVTRTASVSGVTTTGHYSFTDDGTTAILRIDVDFSMAAMINGFAVADEHAPPPPLLTFSQPVMYSMQIGLDATGTNVTSSVSEGFGTLDQISSPPFTDSMTGDNPSVTIPTKTGTWSGPAYFREEIELDNARSAAHGTGFFQLTLTALPQGSGGGSGVTPGVAVPVPPAAWAALTTLPLVLLGRRLYRTVR